MGVNEDGWVGECGCGQSRNQSEKTESIWFRRSKSLSIPIKTGEVMQLLQLIKSIFDVKFLSEYIQFTLVFARIL
jgi:hypothetical protein